MASCPPAQRPGRGDLFQGSPGRGAYQQSLTGRLLDEGGVDAATDRGTGRLRGGVAGQCERAGQVLVQASTELRQRTGAATIATWTECGPGGCSAPVKDPTKTMPNSTVRSARR